MNFQKNSPTLIRSWCMYDWANSAYNLVITSTIFPAYYQSVTHSKTSGDIIDFCGFKIINTVLYTYSLSFSFLIVAIFIPFLTGIADYSGKKKIFLRFFCYLGSLSCIGLYFFDSNSVEWGILCSVIACIGYSGSLVFYNAYLPEIVSESKIDSVSARGYIYGYIGSVLLLIFNLSMLLKPEWYGDISKGLASRISFLTVGIWWAGFAQITFYFLPNSDKKVNLNHSNYIINGYNEFKEVGKFVFKDVNLKLFLLGFLFYNMGVQTVMYVATLFGEKTLHLDTSQLITVVLILQLIAIPGSLLFSFLSNKFGNIRAIIPALLIWIVICFLAFFVYFPLEFYSLAVVVGFVMGGIQSLSRATYAKLLPKDTEDHASFFSFYDVSDKMSIVIGTLTYGFIEQITHNMRYSIIVLAVYFIIGLFFIFKLKRKFI